MEVRAAIWRWAQATFAPGSPELERHRRRLLCPRGTTPEAFARRADEAQWLDSEVLQSATNALGVVIVEEDVAAGGCRCRHPIRLPSRGLGWHD